MSLPSPGLRGYKSRHRQLLIAAALVYKGGNYPELFLPSEFLFSLSPSISSSTSLRLTYSPLTSLTMSLFRTLQSSPATISIFHNPNVPALARLYKLVQNASYQINDSDTHFVLDLAKNQMPTYDQFRLLSRQFTHNSAEKNILRECYPFLSNKRLQNGGSSVTIASPINSNLNIFSEAEYQMVHEAFNHAVEANDPELKPEDIFAAPLVVDWDQNLLAASEEGVMAILSKYRSGVEESLLPA